MNAIRHFVSGFLIGIANIIPGMSGGTLALVLGIYERIIVALRNIGDLSTLKKFVRLLTLRKEVIKQSFVEFRRSDISFLVTLGIGSIAAVLLTSKLVVYVLHYHHDATYGFFSGLILASILIPARMLSRFRSREFLVFLLAVALICGLSISTGASALAEPGGAETSVSSLSVMELGTFFAGGAVAISAMILPGISGSFLMLAFGLYFPLLTAIDNVLYHIATGQLSPVLLSNLLRLACFALGCLIGVVGFTRLLNYLLERYRELTIAFLIGLMVGSLYGLWPFRDFVMVDGARVYTTYRLPQLDGALLLPLTMFLIGGGIILAFSYLGKEKTASRLES